MKKIKAMTAIPAAVLLVVLSGVLLYTGADIQANSEKNAISVSATVEQAAAYVVPTVKDAVTGEVIADATIVVAETGQAYATSADGTTEPIPCAASNLGEDYPYGTATLLVYADGYLDYALFNVQAAQGETRNGPDILLFEEGTGQSQAAVVLVESPERAYVDAMLAQLDPEKGA